MGGGLLQLVAYGAQDVYITGNPQVTFFKLVYRRHTNFSMETIEQTFNGSPNFGRKVTCTLSRNGDLVHKVWLEVDLPAVTIDSGNSERFRWLNWIGHVLIDYVEFEIGGQKIDKQYGEWMHIWSELTCKPGHAQGYAAMVGNTPALTNMRTTGSCPASKLYIPLQFYFCKNAGLAVPLVALQYHEVKITVSFRPSADCCFNPDGITVPALGDVRLLVDYIFLDADERRRFAQVSHEYLITQLQFTGDESTTNTRNKFKLSFNHPTKEIVWVVRKSEFTNDTTNSGKQWFNFSDTYDTTYLTGQTMGVETGIAFQTDLFLDALTADNFNLFGATSSNSYNLSNIPSYSNTVGGTATPTRRFASPVDTAKLVLNGHDRFTAREAKWFNLCVPYACHENIPSCGIHVYSFGLRPEEHQPTGSINFSRIDTANLHIDLTENYLGTGESAIVKIYGVSYNILRILSGMGGLAYSNITALFHMASVEQVAWQ